MPWHWSMKSALYIKLEELIIMVSLGIDVDITLMAKDVEHFKCFSAIWDSSNKNYLFRSVPYF